MKKGLTELVFILDRSGSMSGLESDTIGGYNSMLSKQKNTDGDALISTILFDTELIILHDRLPLDEIRPMTEREYRVGGCTALLDAMGRTIENIASIQKHSRDEDRPEKTMFVIITDGLENSSTLYNYQKINSLVSFQKEKFGWEFLFLGANMDAIGEAEKMGIHADRAVTYECDRIGTVLNYQVVGDAVAAFRSQSPSLTFGAAGNWKDRIEEDYRARHK